MLSINTNSSALTALQALEMTQQSLNQTQQEVSTGYAVNSAADNPSYFSIASQLNTDNGIISATNTALAESQSILGNASSALDSIQTTINSIQTALTQAEQPGADVTNINVTLSALGQQLYNEVSGASFHGTNLLNNTAVSGASASSTYSQAAGNDLAFVSGYTATSNGGTLSTISLSIGALYTGSSAGATGATGLLTQTVGSSAIDLTSIQLTPVGTGQSQSQLDTQVSNALTAVNQAQSQVINYAAAIGAVQDQMTTASNFNQSLTTNYTNGASALVDADMNVASTRLQALQTQEQLGIQSLSIANQSSQLILKLFGG